MVIDSTETARITYQQNCVHRLPCGYCPLMSRPCPMQVTTVTTWGTTAPNLNEVTCQTTNETKGT